MKLRQKLPTKRTSIFGVELTKFLLERKLTNRALALMLGKTEQWIGDMTHGNRSTPPYAVEAVCEVLKLDEQSRYRLHIAAARDAGYRIPVFL